MQHFDVFYGIVPQRLQPFLSDLPARTCASLPSLLGRDVTGDYGANMRLASQSRRSRSRRCDHRFRHQDMHALAVEVAGSGEVAGFICTAPRLPVEATAGFMSLREAGLCNGRDGASCDQATCAGASRGRRADRSQAKPARRWPRHRSADKPPFIRPNVTGARRTTCPTRRCDRPWRCGLRAAQAPSHMGTAGVDQQGTAGKKPRQKPGPKRVYDELQHVYQDICSPHVPDI